MSQTSLTRGQAVGGMGTGTLHRLPWGVRLGLTGLLAAIVLGMVASAAHLYNHYRNRDESIAFTMDDVKAAYHGLDKPAPLRTALERGHPEGFAGKDGGEPRDVLLAWLKSGRIAEDYENIDLGIASPREILETNCVSCHSSREAAGKGGGIVLDSLTAVRQQASSKTINRNPDRIIIMSAHAHALSLGTLSLVLVAMLWLTRLPRGVVSALAALNGLALVADIASWWLARDMEVFAYLIVGAGGVYNATTTLIAVVVAGAMWWPGGERARGE